MLVAIEAPRLRAGGLFVVYAPNVARNRWSSGEPKFPPLDDGADEVASKLAAALERCMAMAADDQAVKDDALAAYNAYVEKVYGPQDEGQERADANDL